MTNEPTSQPSSKGPAPWLSRRGLIVGLTLYLVLVGVVAFSMLRVRQVTLATMGTPEARAEWNAWRESEPNQRTDLPVSRRPPKSPEPPALVLMRDHFAVLISAAIVFSSLLFAALAIAARGVLAGTSHEQQGWDLPQRSQSGTEEQETKS